MKTSSFTGVSLSSVLAAACLATLVGCGPWVEFHVDDAADMLSAQGPVNLFTITLDRADHNRPSQHALRIDVGRSGTYLPVEELGADDDEGDGGTWPVDAGAADPGLDAGVTDDAGPADAHAANPASTDQADFSPTECTANDVNGNGYIDVGETIVCVDGSRRGYGADLVGQDVEVVLVDPAMGQNMEIASAYWHAE